MKLNQFHAINCVVIEHYAKAIGQISKLFFHLTEEIRKVDILYFGTLSFSQNLHIFMF